MSTLPPAMNSHIPLKESYPAKSQDSLHSGIKSSLEFQPLTPDKTPPGSVT